MNTLVKTKLLQQLYGCITDIG